MTPTLADRILIRIDQLDRDRKPTNKAAITEGLSPRTAARRWRTIESLWAFGYLYRSWPAQGPSTWHLTEDGKRHLKRLK